VANQPRGRRTDGPSRARDGHARDPRGDDIAFEGPLAATIAKDASDALMRVHHANGSILLALVALHVGAVLFHLVVERRNFVAARITGRTPWPDAAEVPEAESHRAWLAAALFALASLAVALVVNAAGLGRTGGGPP
jgi:hypothetical protein